MSARMRASHRPYARFAERAYGLLLRAYPAAFRARFGSEMTLAFRELLRARGSGARVWLEMLWDVARSAPALHVEELRTLRVRNIQLQEGTMRPMAMLALAVGAIQVVNALAEASAGLSATGDGYSLMGVVLGIVAAALLIAAGVALLRGARRATVWARLGAAGCLAVVVLVRFVQPWMSMVGTLLGIGFPIVLLIFLQLDRGHGPSSPARA